MDARKPFLILLILLATATLSCLAQKPTQWMALPWTQDLTFDQVKAAYEAERDAYADMDSTGTQSGMEDEDEDEDEEADEIAFQRFEYFWRPRVNTNAPGQAGKLMHYVDQLYTQYAATPLCTQNLNPSDWQLLGPLNYSSGPVVNHSMGIVVALWADPTEVPLAHVLAGTNCSGLWRGTLGQNGWTWTCLTDDLRMPGMGVSSIAVNTNGDIYIGTTAAGRGGYPAGIWRLSAQDQAWTNLLDFPPTFPDPGVNDIKFIGNYIYVVQAKHIMRAPRNVDLATAGVFTELTVQNAPAPTSVVHYLEITGFTVPAGDGLILCSKGDNGADGGGKVYRSFDAGDTWTDISALLTPQISLLGGVRPYSPLIGDIGTGPNDWQVNGSGFDNIINIQPTAIPSGGLTRTFCAIGPAEFTTTPTASYIFRLACTKNPEVSVKAYLIKGHGSDPIDLDPANSQLVMDVTNNNELPFEATFQANNYYHRIAIQASFPDTYDPNEEPAGVTLDLLQDLPISSPLVAAVFSSSIGHARCSTVNAPGNNPNNGLYVCVLSGMDSEAPYTVYKSTDGLNFTSLFNSGSFYGGFDKNKGVFNVNPNGTMYIGGVDMFSHVPPNYQRTPLNTGHVDMRVMLNMPNAGDPTGGILLVGDDGGVALSANGGSPNATFQDINGASFPITQFYGMGIDEHERLLIGGTQDNNSWKYHPSTQVWEKFDDNDGGRSRSYTNKEGTKWATVNISNEKTKLLVGHGGNNLDCTPTHTHTRIDLGNPAELYVDPNTDEVKCYLGHGDLYRMSCADNPAVNLTAGLVDFHDPGINNFVWGIGVHEKDDNIIYMGGFNQKWDDTTPLAPGRLYRTTDGGSNWTDIGSNLATSGHQPFDWFGVTTLVVDPDVPPTDPATVYVGFNGYCETLDQRVLKTVDGGETWTDISSGLTGFQVNDLAIQKGSGGILYAATDAGVYVYDPQIGSWSCFNQALPICIVTEVDVNTCSGKLYASTYGRGVWVTGLYHPDQVSELNVNADATWSDIREMASTVRVANGATLTITGELRMYPHRGIIVEPGSQLVVDGGTITSTCNGFWPGIQVWGNSPDHQFGIPYPDHQGLLVLKNNAVIEDALLGAQAQNPDDDESTGGVVQATDATFLNCQQAVNFTNYHNFQPPTPSFRVNNFSFFRRVRFEVNDQCPAGIDFQDHVSMSNVDGIVFSQCDFINSRSAGPGQLITQSAELGHGILAMDASFGVFGTCTVIPPDGEPCPDGHTIPSTFTGLDHGVHVLNGGGIHPFTLDHCDFTNNICAVYANGVIGCKVTGCNITLGDRDVELNGDEDGAFFGMHRGIFLTESYDLIVDENHLFSSGGAAETEGIVIGYSRDNNEMVFRNQATGLTNAYVGEGICVDVNNKPGVGLTFKCNENTDNEYDFWNRMVLPIPFGTFPADQTIRTIQGEMDRPADNSFDRNAGPPEFSDFTTNSSLNVLTYIFKDEDTPYQPADYQAPYITISSADSRLGNNCRSRLIDRIHEGPVEVHRLIELLQEHKLAYGNTRYLYDQLIDGGSTDQTVQEIQESWPEEAWELRAMLLAKSPYLSTEVLMEMDKKGILPDAMVAEICIANPEATSKDGFTDWLEFKAPHPLPGYLIDQIIASWDSKTYRFTLERDMAQHHQDMTQAAVLWLDHFQSDTAYAPADSLRRVWRQVRTSAARYAEALTFVEEHRYDSARIVVEMIPVEDLKLKERQLMEKDRMLQLIDFFRDMDVAGRNAAQLRHEDITRLEGIIDGQYDRPATWAQNLLCFHYGICRPPLTGGKERAEPRMVHAPTADQAAKALPALIIRPNPATTWVVFEYRIIEPVKDAYIRVTGIDGRELTKLPITAPEGQPVYDTRQVAKGAYTVELVNAGKTVETGKLMVE